MDKLTKSQQLEQENNQVVEQFNILRNSVENISDIPQFILEHQTLFWKGAALSDPRNIWELVNIKKRKGIVLPTPKLIDITKFEYRWRDKINNFHATPIGATRSNITKFYPGWEGTISWKVEWPAEFSSYYLGSQLFYNPHCGIYQGSGGGGQGRDNTQTFHYGFIIFAANFPKLYEQEMKSKYLINENQSRRQAWRAVGGVSNPAEVTEIPKDWVMPDPLQGV